MINPSVTNADRSDEVVAVVVDDVLSAGLSKLDKGSIERCIKDSGRGSTTAARYFLKEDVVFEARSLSGVPKSKLRKRRCCSISICDLDQVTLLDFRQGLSCLYVCYTTISDQDI